MVGACSPHLKIRNEYKIVVGKPEARRLLRRSKHTWEGNIKMALKEIGLKNVE